MGCMQHRVILDCVITGPIVLRLHMCWISYYVESWYGTHMFIMYINVIGVTLTKWPPYTDSAIFSMEIKPAFTTELYKKRGALFQEESYLATIFRSSSLNLHTIHLPNIVFWWQIFFRKHGKSTPNDRHDRHVLVVDVVIMTSQCRCTRALSQSQVVNHDNHVPVTPSIGSGQAVMSMQWPPYGKIISTKH